MDMLNNLHVPATYADAPYPRIMPVYRYHISVSHIIHVAYASGFDFFSPHETGQQTLKSTSLAPIPMGQSKSVYASVKSYSLRGKLLTREDYQMLAESRNLDELMTRLRNTVYENVVAETPKPYTARGIEASIRGHLAYVHYNIARTVGNAPILNAYYMRFIVSNLKAVLKGKALGKTQEEIESQINLRLDLFRCLA